MATNGLDDRPAVSLYCVETTLDRGTSCSDEESIGDYYNRLTNIFKKLMEFDYQMDQYQMIVFLRGLPPIFEPTVSTILQKDIKEWNMTKLRSVLVEAQQRLKSYEDNNEYVSAFKAKKKIPCSYCKKNTHHPNNCWFNPKNKDCRPKWLNDKQNESDENNFSLVAQNAFKLNTDTNSKMIFYIDSGASQHFCNNKELFTQFEEIPYYDVSVANGNSVKAIAKGSIEINLNNNKQTKIKINNVQYTPNMKYNLLSVRQLEKSGAIGRY